MATLLLRLSGPLQSWGADSKFEVRSTRLAPTKSGVIGMIASALGRRREEPIDDLASLRFGVRSDQMGKVISDYHTAHHPTDAKRAYITNRQYLEDSCFVVGLSGDMETLQRLERALLSPYFPLYLGRRSCPPTGKLVIGIVDDDLHNALENVPWQASEWYARTQAPHVNLSVEMDAGWEFDNVLIRDNPIRFDKIRREHHLRSMERSSVTVPNPFSEKEPFDPFDEVQRCARCS